MLNAPPPSAPSVGPKPPSDYEVEQEGELFMAAMNQHGKGRS